MNERLDVIEKNMGFIGSMTILHTIIFIIIYIIIYMIIFTIIYKSAIIYLESETRCDK